jgi:hypothetical protein
MHLARVEVSDSFALEGEFRFGNVGCVLELCSKVDRVHWLGNICPPDNYQYGWQTAKFGAY